MSAARRTPPPPYRVVGVTGLPCSGKTYAAQLLAEGAITGAPGYVVNADEVGHQVLALPEVADAVRARFGDGVFADPDPKAVRKRIGDVVFADPGELAWLESVTHPLISRETRRVIAATNGFRMVVIEAALLFAADMDKDCQRIVLVEAERRTRLARAALRGWDEAELDRREARLLPLFAPDMLAKVADKLIKVHNDADDGSMEEELRSHFGLSEKGD